MKATMGLVIAILVVSILTLFWPDSMNDEFRSSVVSMPEVQTEVDAATSNITDGVQQTGQAEQMQAEYALLEQARKDLKRLLARLKHEMWGMQFAPEQAKEINAVMLNAHRFEKTPRLLGAFHAVDEIKDEHDRVLYAIKSLQEVEAWIQQAQTTSSNPE